jgi:hypothetical protein
MLRITADCDEVPTQVIDTVTELKQTSKRHVRQVRFSFINYELELSVVSALRPIFGVHPREAHAFCDLEERPIVICELFHSRTV